MDISELLGAAVARVEAPPGADAAPGPPGVHGLLPDLAAWWQRTGGDGAPERVRHLWAAAPPAAVPPSAAEMSTLPLDPPDDPGEAFRWGTAAADAAADEGADLLLVSAPDPFADALAAFVLQLDPVDAIGVPSRSGLDDDAWVRAVAGVRDGLRRLHGVRPGAAAALRALDRPVPAAGAGVLVQAAARRTPVLLDGPGAAACAVLVHQAVPAAARWWQAAHGTGHPLHDAILGRLRLRPLTRLDVLAEDGTGARLGLAVLEAAVAGFGAPGERPEGHGAVGSGAAAPTRDTGTPNDTGTHTATGTGTGTPSGTGTGISTATGTNTGTGPAAGTGTNTGTGTGPAAAGSRTVTG